MAVLVATDFRLKDALFWGPIYCILDTIYRVIRYFWHLLQDQFWNFENQPDGTCELLKIVFKKKNYFQYDRDFMWMHGGFYDAKMLLEGDWLMHRVSTTHAYFARLPNPVHTHYDALQVNNIWIYDVLLISDF